MVRRERRRVGDLEVRLDRRRERLRQDGRERPVDAGHGEPDAPAGPASGLGVERDVPRVGVHVVGDDDAVALLDGREVRRAPARRGTVHIASSASRRSPGSASRTAATASRSRSACRARPAGSSVSGAVWSSRSCTPSSRPASVRSNTASGTGTSRPARSTVYASSSRPTAKSALSSRPASAAAASVSACSRTRRSNAARTAGSNDRLTDDGRSSIRTRHVAADHSKPYGVPAPPGRLGGRPGTVSATAAGCAHCRGGRPRPAGRRAFRAAAEYTG